MGSSGDSSGDESSSGESIKLTSEDDDAGALWNPLPPPARFSRDNERIDDVSDCVEYDVERCGFFALKLNRVIAKTVFNQDKLLHSKSLATRTRTILSGAKEKYVTRTSIKIVFENSVSKSLHLSL